MAGEEIYKEEARGINRLNFLKSAGVVVTGSTLRRWPATSAAAAPTLVIPPPLWKRLTQ